MLDELITLYSEGAPVDPVAAFFRLVTALGLGVVVAWIYRHTRKSTDVAASFPTTLVLLSVLIAMVTQVIGDNVARAFSLVGALAIVRFRTVVRDTQDTAYVIFAVVVGMAVGAHNLWVAIIGTVVVGTAAWAMSTRAGVFAGSQPVYLLSVRVGLGQEIETGLGVMMDKHLQARELMSLATARQGVSLDASYEARMKPGVTAEELVRALNRMEGVESVQMERRTYSEK